MFEKIKTLATDTLTYGISTVVSRFLTFLLVPFYTNILRPEDYGIVAYFYSLIAFLTIVYGYGMESAFFRFYSSLEIGDKKENFSTPFISLFISSFFVSILITIFSDELATFTQIKKNANEIIIYSSWILFFDTVAFIPFGYLRMERKSKQFAFLKFLNVLINVVLNVILLHYFKFGIVGVFLSGLISSLVTILFLISIILKNFIFSFNKKLFKKLFKFAIPYLPSGLAMMAIQVIDRPILLYLTDEKTVGVYQANYRLGIVMMLFVSMFDMAWRPFFLTHSKDENAKKMFSKIFTYFCLIASVVFLTVSLFIEDIVKIQVGSFYFLHPNYWSGLNIVPIVLLSYVFLGMYNNFIAGIYIEKKTSWLPIISLIGGIANVLFNFILIPESKGFGAAVSTLISYFLIAISTYFISQKFYSIKFETSKIVRIFLITFFIYFISIYFQGTIFVKLFYFILFLSLLLVFKIFEREVNMFKDILKSIL